MPNNESRVQVQELAADLLIGRLPQAVCGVSSQEAGRWHEGVCGHLCQPIRPCGLPALLVQRGGGEDIIAGLQPGKYLEGRICGAYRGGDRQCCSQVPRQPLGPLEVAPRPEHRLLARLQYSPVDGSAAPHPRTKSIHSSRTP